MLNLHTLVTNKSSLTFYGVDLGFQYWHQDSQQILALKWDVAWKSERLWGLGGGWGYVLYKNVWYCIELSHVDDIVWIFSFDILCTHVDILLFSFFCMFVDVFSVGLNERKSNQNQVESYFDPCWLCVLNPSPQEDHEISVALYYPLTCLGDPCSQLITRGPLDQ